MMPIDVIKDLKLLSWSTLLLGLTKGWVNRKDVIDYAVGLLASGSNELDIAVIAGGESLSEDEFCHLMIYQVSNRDDVADLEKWRLANLICIAESNSCQQEKLNTLQEVYVEFDYPSDMKSCSIYSQDDFAPLVAMMVVIRDLREDFTS
ncbi:MAG: DUF2247 family protein [Desulfotalea sp.]